ELGDLALDAGVRRKRLEEARGEGGDGDVGLRDLGGQRLAAQEHALEDELAVLAARLLREGHDARAELDAQARRDLLAAAAAAEEDRLGVHLLDRVRQRVGHGARLYVLEVGLLRDE